MIQPRIVIDEKDFRKLVAGKTVIVNCGDNIQVHIILADIGWTKMQQAVADAKKGA